jgi:hypothetical protein
MEQLKKRRGKPVDHDLALAVMEGIASAEHAMRGFNSQLLQNDDGHFAKRVRADLNVARDPKLEPRWKSIGDERPLPNPDHPDYPNIEPAPVAPWEREAALAPESVPAQADPAPTPPLDAAAIEEAVVRALRRVLPPSLTNRAAASEAPKPPKVTPEASPAEQAAWTPIVEPTNSDEPAQDGQPAKGGRKKPPAE